MKQLIILILVLVNLNEVYAQTTHNINCSSCAYSKNRVKDASRIGTANETCSCVPCREKRNKEKAAKQAEIKRRQDVIADKIKAEKDARDKAFAAEQKKKQEESSKAKSGELLINAQPTKAVAQKQEKKATNIGSQRFMQGSNGNWEFYNENSEKIVRPNAEKLRPIHRAYGTFRIEGKSIARYLHPAEIGVIAYFNNNPVKYCNGSGLNQWDIVDYNWKPLFNDESVHFIEHFYENWFLIGYLPCENYESGHTGRYKSLKLYNVSSKMFIDVKTDLSYFMIDLVGTNGTYHKGDGMAIFHNPHYLTGEYSDTNLAGEKIKHGGCELLFDERLGGTGSWKAGFIYYVRNSSSNPNDGYHVCYLMNKDNKFTSFTITSKEWLDYNFKSAK
ncbi:MAG: cell envelope integrity protein TolA [Rufibacter sp.]